jgi:hypothetical protein
MAELLDDVISEVLEYVQGGDYLVVVEGVRRSLAEEKDSLEHVHCGLADSCLEESQFPLRVTCIFSIIVAVIIGSRFFGVNTPLMPRLATGFQGFKLNTRHQLFLQALRADPCGIRSCHCKALSQVKGQMT